MKLFRLVLIVAILSIICAPFSGVGSALEQDEVMVQLMWSSQTIHRGGNATLTVFFVSESSDELEIYRLGLHFDWMATGSFVGFDMSDNPMIIPNHGTHYFNPMIILVPEDVSVGSHVYTVTIEGYQGDAAARARGETTYFFWEESWPRTPSLLILDSGEEVNNDGAGAVSQQDQFLIVGGVVVVVIVAILIIIWMRHGRKR